MLELTYKVIFKHWDGRIDILATFNKLEEAEKECEELGTHHFDGKIIIRVQ